ncbi:hypothetical protein DY000_02003359 [Brassica cretica]|uniref:Uncharacterized protein n=1 Tax=Brassica cretica TaxID=69181 RepID=A0ABQ7C6A6_BRACR|nr:hypothetical protein DY000_02003359 [Brassica cretica]
MGQQNLALGLKFNAKAVLDCFEKELQILPNGRRREIDFKMVEGDFQLFEGKWSIEQVNIISYDSPVCLVAAGFGVSGSGSVSGGDKSMRTVVVRFADAAAAAAAYYIATADFIGVSHRTRRSDAASDAVSCLDKGIQGEALDLQFKDFPTTLAYTVDVKPKMWLPVRLVEGRLCKEIKTNLLSIRDTAQKVIEELDAALEALTKPPIGRNDVESCFDSSIAELNFERERLAIKVGVALPVSSPVS